MQFKSFFCFGQIYATPGHVCHFEIDYALKMVSIGLNVYHNVRIGNFRYVGTKHNSSVQFSPHYIMQPDQSFKCGGKTFRQVNRSAFHTRPLSLTNVTFIISIYGSKNNPCMQYFTKSIVH